MRRPRWYKLVQKAISACVAAIEVYNKPAFPHREETFAILVVAAWEGLLKARIVKEYNKLDAIYALEHKPSSDGNPRRRAQVRLNRAGNPMTIGLSKAIEECAGFMSMPLDKRCEKNLELLIEIRDNAVHFMNDDKELARRVHETGSAALQNFSNVLGEWFDYDLGDQRFAILPLSFEPLSSANVHQPGRRGQRASNLLAYINGGIDASTYKPGDSYAVALRLETRLVGGRNKEAVAIRPTSDPSAPVVRLVEEDWLRQYPLDRAALVRRLKKRVTYLKQNGEFNSVVGTLRRDPRLAGERKLDPSKQRGPSTWRYADAMVEAVEKQLKPA